MGKASSGYKIRGEIMKATTVHAEPSAIVGMEPVADLLSLIPDLEYGKETHRQWRDCDQSRRDANPDIGDSAFHDSLVDIYNNRIATVKFAADQLSVLQAKLEQAEKDAERYLWLRIRLRVTPSGLLELHNNYVPNENCSNLTDKHLDAAIDAAIAKYEVKPS